jgi:integrase
MTPDLAFSTAIHLWLEQHKVQIAERTQRDYEHYARTLVDYFGDTPLSAIGIDAIRGFQDWRWRNGTSTGPDSKFKHAAASVRVKNEINCCLKPLLKEVGLWEVAAKRFKHLSVPRDGSGCALTAEETTQILTTAFSTPRCTLAAHLLVVMYRTGTCVGELRKLRRRDVDLEAGTISVVLGAKNSGERVRRLALVPSALQSMRWLVQRCTRLGGSKGDDYLLPFRGGDFSRPMTSIYRSFISIRAEWIRRYDPPQDKRRLRLYDARVTVASTLLANPNLSLPTIERTLGWAPSSAMRKRYFRCETETQRSALATLEAAAPSPIAKPEPPKPKPAPKPLQRKKLAQLATGTVGGVAVPALVAALRKAGIGAEQILDILTSAKSEGAVVSGDAA